MVNRNGRFDPNDLLVVVDMQNDFIDGVLGCEEAVALVPKITEKASEFCGRAYFTRDTHYANYLKTQEGRKLPVPHCIEGTYGWKIRTEIESYRATEAVNKRTFGSVELGERMEDINAIERIDSVTVVGLYTDICVISNAILLKAYLPEARIIVDSSCCVGTTVEKHNIALEAMKACQIEII